MKQDIKFNGWVLVSAVLQIIISVVCLGAGGALAIMGITNASKLLKIKEINFLINQQSVINFQKNLFGGILLEKYLFLFIGALVVFIGIISLVLAIVELLYVKKYNVVNHRVALIFFSLIPLVIASCVEAYLLIEYDVLKGNIDYIRNIRIACFAVCGVFSVCAICALLGVLFSKSEQFMSNDNNKYAFEGPKSSRSVQGNEPARMPARSQILGSQQQVQSVNPIRNNSQNPNVRPQQAQRRADGGQIGSNNIGQPGNFQQRMANPNVRPMANAQTARPQQRMSQQHPMANNVLAQRSNENRVAQRPITSSPAGSPSAQRRSQPAQIRRCPKCGKTLMPNERVCTNCNKPGN